VFYKSADYGTTWQADTAGISQLSSPGVFGVDEYGNVHCAATGVGSFGAPWPYNKPVGGSFAPDTAGIGNGLGQFVSVNAFASDGIGNLFMGAGGNASKLICWRRPVNGGAWVPDTAGFEAFTVVTYLTCDTSHNMLALANHIYRRQNGVWNIIPPPNVTGNGSLEAISTDNTGGILAAVSPAFNNSGNGVYCTHDLGATWNFVGLEGIHVYALYSFGDTTYALSDRGIYALTCGGVILGISQPQQAQAASHLSLYPNPAQGDCNAVFTLPASSAKSEFDIVDVSGRILKTIPVPTGTNTLNFGTDNFSRGIYFCVLKADDLVVDVRKLVVVK
jgi:hypothetical protein